LLVQDVTRVKYASYYGCLSAQVRRVL